jgi:hypothetical protein
MPNFGESVHWGQRQFIGTTDGQSDVNNIPHIVTERAKSLNNCTARYSDTRGLVGTYTGAHSVVPLTTRLQFLPLYSKRCLYPHSSIVMSNWAGRIKQTRVDAPYTSRQMSVPPCNSGIYNYQTWIGRYLSCFWWKQQFSKYMAPLSLSLPLYSILDLFYCEDRGRIITRNVCND